MENNDNYIEIEKYLNEEMESSELQVFENKLVQDKEVGAAVDFYKKVAEATELKSLFAEAEKEMEAKVIPPVAAAAPVKLKEKKPSSSENNVFHLSRSVLALAASVLVLIFSTWWLFSPSKPVLSPELIALADKNFVHYPIQARGDESNPTLYDNYKSKNYQLAAAELEKYAIANEDNKALSYSAIAYLGLDNPNKTITLLNSLEEKNLQNRKYYYLGIAYLKKGQKDAAVDALKQVNDFDVFLYSKAVDLINTLEK